MTDGGGHVHCASRPPFAWHRREARRPHDGLPQWLDLMRVKLVARYVVEAGGRFERGHCRRRPDTALTLPNAVSHLASS
jgi:hypothetical protein